jgi:hypothetical protein
MQNAEHKNASRLASEEYDVLALFHAAQAGANVVAGRQPLDCPPAAGDSQRVTPTVTP